MSENIAPEQLAARDVAQLTMQNMNLEIALGRVLKDIRAEASVGRHEMSISIYNYTKDNMLVMPMLIRALRKMEYRVEKYGAATYTVSWEHLVRYHDPTLPPAQPRSVRLKLGLFLGGVVIGCLITYPGWHEALTRFLESAIP